MATIVVLEPVAEPRPVSRELSPRPATLAGKRVGFLSNTKPNVGALFAAIERRIRERYDVASIVHHAKTVAAVSAGAAILDAMARECDVAIVAIGD